MELLCIGLPLALLFLLNPLPSRAYTAPLNCSDTGRLCTSFLAVRSNPNLTLPLLHSMFDVLPGDITVDDAGSPGYFYIKKNCSCSSSTRKYLSNTTFTVRAEEGPAYGLVTDAYGALAFFQNSSRWVRSGAVVSLHLLCGCSSGLWNYLMTYVLGDGETIGSLASRFGVSMDDIETVNGIADPNSAVVGEVYYVPLLSIPGEPYPTEIGTSPAPAPAFAPATLSSSVNQEHHSAKFPYGWILGSMGIALFLIVITILTCIILRSSAYCYRSPRNQKKDPDEQVSHEFHVLGRTKLCCGSKWYLCFKSGKWMSNSGDASSNQMNIPKSGMEADAFEMEKPIVFTYEEIISSTSAFSDSNLLGHGTYGSVYYGVLRDQEVAIKRMSATKTKEFMAEMKVLCKVHHASLVELIGYAASNDELFLVYEYAQKGSLKNHLHDPVSKGHTSLSWISRVQIALDAAKGLEYIHEHTRTHYVHRDIKTSNILLDSSFRAKISDFGLAKLVGKTGEGEASATRVVGTFGYLAPEYLRDGLATTKSDVYAFGIVIFELISGREAITRTEGAIINNAERRSLASVMLAALRNSPNSMSMGSLKGCIDPNLMELYPHDCMAMLAKQCVDEDPILRPDMKQVVISLSHILLSSVEWEATLAGNSQVFSGLVQGR
ncbi:hypothetical protein Taro_011247 [Colocasia esculenta]|uniref:LysM domain receptor-like kinase 3 n=1 Tax=Colocasia esculenta TaxID=4460 RepID=A0A843UAE0_COLES|nr:hypothetical protein [Colocasia esculenta]